MSGASENPIVWDDYGIEKKPETGCIGVKEDVGENPPSGRILVSTGANIAVLQWDWLDPLDHCRLRVTGWLKGWFSNERVVEQWSKRLGGVMYPN